MTWIKDTRFEDYVSKEPLFQVPQFAAFRESMCPSSILPTFTIFMVKELYWSQGHIACNYFLLTQTTLNGALTLKALMDSNCCFSIYWTSSPACPKQETVFRRPNSVSEWMLQLVSLILPGLHVLSRRR